MSSPAHPAAAGNAARPAAARRPAPATLRLPASRRAVPTSTRLRTRRIPLPAYVVILLALPVAVLAGADAAGWLVNKGRFVPASALGADALGVAGRDADAGRGAGAGRGEAGAGRGEAGTGRGEAGTEAGTGGAGEGGRSGGAGKAPVAPGSLDPDDVRGSTTMQQVLDAFPRVTAAELCARFGVPVDTPTSTQLKTLAQTGNGYEVSELREWLKTRTGDS